MRKSLLVLLCSVFFILSCTQVTNGPEVKPFLRSNDQDNEASCTYQFSEGGLAPISIPAENFKISLFEKKYDQSLLNSVLNVSAAELVRFASLLEVQFYKINNPNRQTCLFTDSLPAAPEILKKYFNKVESKSANEDEKKKSILLGLYLSKDAVAEILLKGEVDADFYNLKSSILVRNDSDKHTMTHEYMHHLFNRESLFIESIILKQRSESANDFLNLFNLSKNQTDEIQSYSDLNKYVVDHQINSIEDYENHVSKLELMTLNYLNVLKEFTLEEVAIESELSEKYASKEFTFIDEKSRINGDKYLISKAVEASTSLDVFIKFIQAYQAKESQLVDQEDQVFIEKSDKIKKKLSLLSRAIFDIKMTAASAAFKAKMRLKNSYSAIAGEESKTENKFSVCPHVYEEINNVFKTAK